MSLTFGTTRLTHQGNQLVHARGVTALDLLDQLAILVQQGGGHFGDLEVLLSSESAT